VGAGEDGSKTPMTLEVTEVYFMLLENVDDPFSLQHWKRRPVKNL